MTKPKLLTNQNWKEHQFKQIEALLPNYEVYTDADQASNWEETEVVIHWTPKMTELFEAGKLPNLKWVQVISAGVNSVPLEAFAEKGIHLTNASGIHQYTISEFVIGALLFYTRRFQTLQRNQQKQVWDEKTPIQEIQELRGKTMMIYGIGNIGRRLATIASAFEMKTIGVNRSGRDVPEVDQVVTQDHADDLIGEADIIVTILPGTEETDSYFDQNRMSKMKKGALFVNVGRGNSVDSHALIEALDNDTIAYAALDVFENEPLEADSPLWQHEKIFISPHISGTLEHFRDSLFPVVEENLLAYAENGKPSENVIDYDKNY